MISVDSFNFSFSNIVSEPYNVTVNCTIHSDSTADHCVVMVVDNGSAITGSTYVKVYNVFQILYKFQ